MTTFPADSQTEDLIEHELCFSCLKENEPGIHFCKHCHTPLTSYATTGPIERMYAFGDFARKAVRHPKRWIRTLAWLLIISIGSAILFGMLLP